MHSGSTCRRRIDLALAKGRLGAALVFPAFLVACAAAPPPPPPPMAAAALVGRVFDADTGQPVGQAFLILRTSPARHPQMEVTAAHGRFAFDLAAEGDELLVAKSGYEDVRVQVTTLSHELSVGLKPSAPWASRDRIQAPRQLQGYNPHYSSEALRLHVEGTMYVRCAIRLSTRVEDCAILQGLPAMNDNVKFAYEQRRYAPAVIDGVPTEVDFVFRMTIAFE